MEFAVHKRIKTIRRQDLKIFAEDDEYVWAWDPLMRPMRIPTR